MFSPQTKILLVEDEQAIRRFLRVTLIANNYDLIESTHGQEGLSLIASQNPSLVILDLGLPDMDGLDFTKELRSWSSVPVIILSARGQEQDKVDALDAGADDYLTKPFGPGELLARIRVALRRAEQIKANTIESIYTFGSISVDLSKRQIKRNNEEIHLTPIEYKLLAFLIKHSGKVLTHRQLLKEVWGQAYADENHYLRVYMAQLRHKLENEPARPQFLITEAGVGYRLKEKA